MEVTKRAGWRRDVGRVLPRAPAMARRGCAVRLAARRGRRAGPSVGELAPMGAPASHAGAHGVPAVAAVPMASMDGAPGAFAPHRPQPGLARLGARRATARGGILWASEPQRPGALLGPVLLAAVFA